jgi:hypothetical protein
MKGVRFWALVFSIILVFRAGVHHDSVWWGLLSLPGVFWIACQLRILEDLKARVKSLMESCYCPYVDYFFAPRYHEQEEQEKPNEQHGRFYPRIWS